MIFYQNKNQSPGVKTKIDTWRSGKQGEKSLPYYRKTNPDIFIGAVPITYSFANLFLFESDHAGCQKPFFTIDKFEFNQGAALQRLIPFHVDYRKMEKDLLVIFVDNIAIAFVFIEPLHPAAMRIQNCLPRAKEKTENNRKNFSQSIFPKPKTISPLYSPRTPRLFFILI